MFPLSLLFGLDLARHTPSIIITPAYKHNISKLLLEQNAGQVLGYYRGIINFVLELIFRTVVQIGL